MATNVNDLVEAAVTARLVRQRALDPIKILNKPYDVVAQHVVGLAALAPAEAEGAFMLVRRAEWCHATSPPATAVETDALERRGALWRARATRAATSVT